MNMNVCNAYEVPIPYSFIIENYMNAYRPGSRTLQAINIFRKTENKDEMAFLIILSNLLRSHLSNIKADAAMHIVATGSLPTFLQRYIKK